MKLVILLILLISIVNINTLKPSDCKCRSSVSSRIVGGKIAADQQAYPWLASVVASSDPTEKLGLNNLPCMATILNEHQLLTSINCVPEEKEYWISIRGINKLIEIKSIEKSSAGLAILELATPLNFTKFVQPACFKLDNQNKYENLKIAGFGSTTPVTLSYSGLDGIKMSKKLKEGIVSDRTDQICPTTKDKMICINGSANVCVGDNGSALMWDLNGRTYTVGIIQSTNFILKKDFTVVLCKYGGSASRLSHYRDFIEQNVGDNYCH